MNSTESKAGFAIFSPSEAVETGCGYWNGMIGFVGHEDASVFTAEQKETLRMPMARGRDARWVPANKEHWRSTLAPGAEVFWNDPGDGLSSGIYVVQDILSVDGAIDDDTILVLKNGTGSSCEVYAHELEPHGPVIPSQKPN